MAVRLGRPPSQLLMPLVFGSHAGSLLALTGTPVNVLVSEAAANAGLRPFGFFEFAIAGVPLVAGTILIVVLFGERLLPRRSGRTIPPDLSKHARTLVEQYRLDDGLFQLRLRGQSPLIGTPARAVDLSGYTDVSLVAVQAGDGGGPLQRPALAEGDVLIVRGKAETIGCLASDKLLALRDEATPGSIADTLFNRSMGLAEVVIPPRSALIGQSVFPGMITPSGNLVILAVQRRGEDQGPSETALEAGDTLLLQGTWQALDEQLEDPDVLVVDSPELVRRQAVPMGVGAKTAIAILLGMVILLATGVVPSVIAGLVAACAMVLFRVVTVDQAYRSINWTTVILIGAIDPALHRDVHQRRRAADGGRSGSSRRRRWTSRTSRRAVSVDRDPRPAHQQYRDGVDHHPDRGRRLRRNRRLGAPRADERHDRLGSRLPHPGRHAGQPDGDGTGRLQVRRLLEARAAAAPAVLRCRDVLRAAGVAVLTPLRQRPAASRALARIGICMKRAGWVDQLTDACHANLVL